MYQESTSNGMFDDPCFQSSPIWLSIPPPEPIYDWFEQEQAGPPADECGSHLSEEHKHETTPIFPIVPKFTSKEAIGANSTHNSTTGPKASPPLMPDSDSDSSQPEKKQPSKKKSKRDDGNNNIHKKFITAQNDVLKEMKMVSKIKKGLKSMEMTFPKGSRYSFVTRLIDVQEILEKHQFDQFLQRYCSKIVNTFELPNNPTKADKLLKSLVKIYCSACRLFAEGKVQESVEVIYDIPGAKERTYRGRGIEAVLDYRKQRFPEKYA